MFYMSGMLVNQLITSDEFFHWLSSVIFLIFELILSRICLLTFPSSLFAGFMGRHVGWLAKLSLWFFRVIKACCFAICFVRLSMLGSQAIDFACESIMLAVAVLPFLQVVVMLSLRSLSCCVLSIMHCRKSLLFDSVQNRQRKIIWFNPQTSAESF